MKIKKIGNDQVIFDCADCGRTYCTENEEHEKSRDGTFKSALESFKEKIKRYSDEYQARCTPQDDWLVITIDYHS